jgi:hypothetical protein
MPIAAAIGIGSAIGGIGSIISGNTQAGAAKSAAQLQAQEAANSLAFQKQEFGTQQANEAPFLQAGQGAVGELSGLTNTPGQGLLTPWTGQFQAPSAQQAAATPGYQFQLQQGEQALQNSAAAQGGLLSGGTATALDQYSQGLASTDYQQVYNNALQQYQQSYNQFENNQANEYNRLAGLAGTGQVSAGQLGQEGAQAAGNVAGINASAGQQIGGNINLAGAATASGYAGLTNSLGAGSNSIGQLALLQALYPNANLLGGPSGAPNPNNPANVPQGNDYGSYNNPVTFDANGNPVGG